MPFAIKKSRFNLSTPAKCTSHVKLSKGGQSTNYIKKSKIQNVYPFLDHKDAKTLLVRAADTYMAYIRATPQGHLVCSKENHIMGPAAYRLINFKLFSVPKW